MINAILQGIMSLIIGLVNIILSPIDLAIKSALPGLSDALGAVGALFSFLISGVGYVIDMTGFNSETISLIILFYTFKLTVPIGFHVVKLAIRWYDKLKP